MSDTTSRPTLLTVCCILSFIAGVFRIVFYSIAYLFAGATVTVNGEEQAGPNIVLISIGLLLTLASLYGVIQMWKLQKIGFYFYSGASIISLTILAIGETTFPYFTVIIGVLFIILFGVNLKHMK